MSVLENLSAAVQKGRAKEVETLVREALESGLTAQSILDGGLLKGMGLIGERFKNNEVFVPAVLIAARALSKGTELLKSRLLEEGVKPIGSVVLGTVKGDLHDIGKNLVKMMLEGAGFRVIDLGVDVPSERFVEAVREHRPDVLALSALLTTTMGQQEAVIKALTAAGLRDKVKVMVGGAPITQSFCEQIGADAYTSDAASAAETAKTFLTA
ncbi:MAG: corrinoid protein [Oscillospiraceae bacterium]|jgi:5-methyltetrahydrofolate--homocysteine methyltransferase|nr:corrinoid protein [Oscillospiraceae bacterium]